MSTRTVRLLGCKHCDARGRASNDLAFAGACPGLPQQGGADHIYIPVDVPVMTDTERRRAVRLVASEMLDKFRFKDATDLRLPARTSRATLRKVQALLDTIDEDARRLVVRLVSITESKDTP